MPGGERFSAAERYEIDKAIRTAETLCRFEFSVFVGAAEEESHPFATRLHAALATPERSVLIMVDPSSHLLEVVTGAEVRRRLADRQVELVCLHMQGAFSSGDLVGGLKAGVLMLAEHARVPRTLHA